MTPLLSWGDILCIYPPRHDSEVECHVLRACDSDSKNNHMRKTTKAAENRRQRFGTMPRLKHHPDKSKPFDHQKSEVVQWLSKQPEFWVWSFAQLQSAKAIVFDPATGE